MEGIATRYAAGLLTLARETDAIKQYKEWLITFERLFRAEQALVKVLNSAFIPLKDKEALIDRINPSEFPYGANFLKLLVAKKRFHYFNAITKQFIHQANALLGIKEGIIHTRYELSEADVTQMEAHLKPLLKCEVELTQIIDATILGGFKITIQGQIFDYSLNHKLEQLATKMLERGNYHAH